ncbi:MAG: MlaD family protein [Opitutaceae bacterium]|nr:MlaD family protein [Opitutaceae bacterium]
MITKFSPAAVGMFVVGALLLAMVAFLSFGGSNFFAKPSRFLVYFDESVSGLELGAAVKMRGVRLGRVANVSVRYDQERKSSRVVVTCEIDRIVLTDVEGRAIDLASPNELQNLIDRGMRARLNILGITGMLYIDLGLEDPRRYPADPRLMTQPLPVVPAIPSPISEVQQSIVEIVANIKQVDFAGLSQDLKTLLATTNRKVADLDVKTLAERVGRAADAVEAFASSPEAKQAFINLNAAIDETRAAVARIEAQAGPVSDELKKTLAEAQTALKSIDETVTTTRRFVAAQDGVGEEVTRTLRQLAEAAAAIERLADYLERNPNALVVGRKRTGAGP